MDCNARDQVVSYAGRAVSYRLAQAFSLLLAILLFSAEKPICADSSDQILLLAFTSEGCPACRALEPLISELERKQYPIRRISPQNSALYEHYEITTMPSFVLLCGGAEHSRFISQGEDVRIVQDRLLTMFQSAREVLVSEMSKKSPTANPLVIPVQGTPSPSSPEKNISPESTDIEKLLGATVRLRVTGKNDETDCGTGTLIHTSQNGEIREGLILTCGHLFRDSKGNSPVQVDLYQPKTEKSTTVTGECVFYDDDLDVGFVGIPLPFPVEPVPLAPMGYIPQPGDCLVSIGCSSGDDPTVWEHTVTSTDQKFYQPKDRIKNQQFYFIEVNNAPCSGRSGGGLFTRTADGKSILVGVCNAGDSQTDEGYFLPTSVVYDQLYANSNLTFVYQDLLREQPTDSEGNNIQTVSFDLKKNTNLDQEKIRQPNFESSPAEARCSKFDELREYVDQGAEVICIVNWPKDAQGRERESEVIRVPRER